MKTNINIGLSGNVNITYNPVVGSGTYTGDATQNRAIPHGLGRIPKFVFIAKTPANDHNSTIHSALAQINDINNGATTAVTAMDINNFYVGDAGGTASGMNVNLVAYLWSAI